MTASDISDLIFALKSAAPDSLKTGMIAIQTVPVGTARIGVITLVRPDQHNALSLSGWTDLTTAIHALCEDLAVRAIVIRGEGLRAFSAGADISEFPVKRHDPESAKSYNDAIASTLEAVQAAPVPVIAMINGLAVGGGFELAAACDVRIASEGSRFGIPIGKLGVILGLTEIRAVAGVIGAASLKHLVFSGRLVGAAKAERWGFIQEVVPEDLLGEAVAELAQNIVLSSETTIRATKQMVALAAYPASCEGDACIEHLTVETYGGADLEEGVAAFLAHRSPRFIIERKAEYGRA